MRISSRNTLPFAILVSFCLPEAFSQIEWVVQGHATTRNLRRLSFIDADTGWAAGDSGTIVRTTDGGVSWTEQNSTTMFDIIDIEVLQEGHGWALAQQYPIDTNQTFGTDLLKTTNHGDDWSLIERFDEFYNSVEFVDTLNGVMGGNLGKLLWTDDGGVSWEFAVIDSPDYGRWPVWHLDFYDSLYGLATGGLFDITGLVWRTTDGGRNWTHRRVAGEPFFGSHFWDSLNVICVGGDIDFGSGMVRTFNAGANWQYTYLGIWGQAVAVAFRTPAEGWAPLGFASTYMVTVDSGLTWDDSFTPDSTAMFDVVFLDSTLGYMVGAGGTVLKYQGPTVGVEDPGGEVPQIPSLSQNYPNPFNPETTVRYRIAERSAVLVTVVDLSGKRVREIERGVQEPGEYEIQFDGSDLASGIYLLRVSQNPVSGGSPHHRSIKMVLLR